MSNVEAHPPEVVCGAGDPPQHAVEVIPPRDVPLGGPRAMTVRRTLPQRKRSLIGAWCFLDHYGPDDVSASGGMDVPPHPHTGLQTVSWLFTGEIEHRDSLGMHAMVRPGELNLMSAGRGICHSEVSTAATTVLHGAQLWIALPQSHRDGPRDFTHYVPEPLRSDRLTARVFLGSLLGSRSPVETAAPILGAELLLPVGSSARIEVEDDFEHGLLVDTGSVEFCGTALERAELGFSGEGRRTLTLRNTGADPARMLLLGGPPFGEEIVMWWNFVGRSHEEIAAFREEWQDRSPRFGEVHGYAGHDPQGIDRLPAPPLPHARITPRRNP
ncbi:pirin family protein [Tomitella fengzijianii]|uniref:Pirin family protein n=1 Tax=Tomitella fengzijianii TaxID=2597660 RepID=A0A516X036_9ACTN|nr:pirin family protein [Tomitella fengzijianii]QDQ96432.1 pirin family protein [Tomitella fengzijianii]